MNNLTLGKLIKRVLVSAIVSGLIVSYSSQNHSTALAQTTPAGQSPEATPSPSNNNDSQKLLEQLVKNNTQQQSYNSDLQKLLEQQKNDNLWLNIALTVLALEGLVYLLSHFIVQLPMQKKLEQFFENIEQNLKNLQESFNNSLNDISNELKSLKTSVISQQSQEPQGGIPAHKPPAVGDVVSKDNSSSSELSQQVEQVRNEFNQQIEEVKEYIVEQITIAINSQTATIQKLPEQVKNNLIQDSKFLEQIAYKLRPELPPQDSSETSSLLLQTAATEQLIENQSDSSPTVPILTKYTLNPEEEKLANDYNQYDLSKGAIEVSVTENSELEGRAGKDVIIIFKQESPGSYWIITAQQGEYLVPNQKRKFNTNQMASVQELFECRSYGPRVDLKNFKLFKPVRVSRAGDSWKLEEKGVLDFNAGG